VDLCGYNHLVTLMEIDFYQEEVVKIETILDTGSEVCFINERITDETWTKVFLGSITLFKQILRDRRQFIASG